MEQLTQIASVESQTVEAQEVHVVELPLDALQSIAGGSGNTGGIVSFLL
jgi:hypothetical protein